jgi:hypothetical protein
MISLSPNAVRSWSPMQGGVLVALAKHPWRLVSLQAMRRTRLRHLFLPLLKVSRFLEQKGCSRNTPDMISNKLWLTPVMLLTRTTFLRRGMHVRPTISFIQGRPAGSRR